LVLGQPGAAQEGAVLLVRRLVLGARGEQQERAHRKILGGAPGTPGPDQETPPCQGRSMAGRPAAALVAALAEALLGVPLPLGLKCWDGSEAAGPPGSPTLVVRSPKALRRIIYAADELGLARAYV